MPRPFKLDGQEYSFPDDVSDKEALDFLQNNAAPPSMADVVAAAPGQAKRQLMSSIAGGEQALGDIFNAEEMQQHAASARKGIALEAGEETPQHMTTLQEGVLSGLSSTIAQIPAVAVGGPLGLARSVATGTLGAGSKLAFGAGTTMMGAQTGLQRYGDERAAGFSPARAALHGAFEGLVEKYTEYLPLKELTGGLKDHLVSFLWKDMTGEQIATLLQDMSAKLSDQPDMTLGDYVHDALVTAIATPVAAGTQVGAIKAAQTLVPPLSAPIPEAQPQVSAPTAQQTPPALPPSAPPLPGPEVPAPSVLPAPPVTSQASVEQPITAPIVQPETAGTVRLYTDMTQGGAHRLVTDNPAALPTQGPVAYSDFTPDQFSKLQQGVPETARMMAEAPGLTVIINSADVPWKSGVPTQTSAVPSAPAAPPAAVEQKPVQDFTTLQGYPTRDIVFPSPTEQALWKLGTALGRYDTQQGVVSAGDMKKLLKNAQKYLKGESAEVSAIAHDYVMGSYLLKATEAKGKIIAPTSAEALQVISTRKATYAQQQAGLVPGKVRIAQDLAQDKWTQLMAGYLQAWTTKFAPRARVVVVEVADPNAGVMATTYYENGVHHVVIPAKQDAETGAPVKRTMSLMALAHEFGHILISEYYNDPALSKGRNALLKEYTRQFTAAKDLTVQEFVHKSRSPQDILEAFKAGGDLFGVGLHEPYAKLKSALEAKMGFNYLESFDEWAAEQFVRYANKERYLLAPPELRDFWQPLMSKMKEFFDMIVKKFQPSLAYSKWLESLTQPNLPGVTPTFSAPTVHPSITQEPVDKFNYTTRVLDRLPSKPTIKKGTIYADVARSDVRKQEREMIGRVLKEFPGDVVDAALFKERVLGELIPLSLQELPGTRWADYGFSALNLDATRGTTSGPHGEWTEVGANVHIWQDSTNDYVSPHFPESTNYWAHTRVANEYPTQPPRGYQPQPPLRRSLVEIQSDLEQKGTQLDEAVVREQLKDTSDLIHDLERHLRGLTSQAEVLQAIKGSPAGVMLWPTAQVGGNFKHNIENLSGVLTLREADLSKNLSSTTSSAALPSKWWELVLLHENTLAAKEGITSMRLVGPNSIVKVEGWPRIYRLPELVGKEIFGLTTYLQAPPTVAAPEFREGPLGFTVSIKSPERPSAWTVTMGQHTFQSLLDQHYFNKPLPVPEVPPEVQPVYRRYLKEIFPFIQKEFGAKLTTDENGNDWYEWTPNAALASMPIRYYSLTQAVGSVVPGISDATKDPETSSSFAFTQGWLQNFLQLNQLAKLLPNVQGLQVYKTTMQALHNLKAKVFAGPNDRIRAWHALGYKQAQKVEQALKEEYNQREHWTLLQQVPISEGSQQLVWIHAPTPGFEKIMQDRGVSKEGQEVFLGVKNDFLSTLQMMEDVVTKNAAEFYKENPLAMAGRLATIKNEFTQLRQTPYLPDMRFGKWWVQIRAGKAEIVDGKEIKKGDLVYWEKFDSKRARDRKYKELERDYGSAHAVSASLDDDVSSTLRGLPQSVLDSVSESLNSDETTKLSPAQMERLADIAFDQTATGKFAKYLGTPKKRLGGATTDLQRSYAAYHWKAGNAIAKLTYFKDLQRAIGQVKSESGTIRAVGGVSDDFDRLVGYLQKNFNYVMQPQSEWERLRSLVSLWYLWGSAKTAFMNLMSVPVLSFPYLWSRFGMLQSQGAMLVAMRQAVQYWKNPESLPMDVQRVLGKFKEDGVYDQSFASMLASIADGGVAFERMIPNWDWLGKGELSYATRQGIWRLVSLGMMPFRVVEQFNRIVTGLAAYQLESKRIGKTVSNGDNEAYQFARDAVDYTQNEYGPWNRPPIMQGKQSIALLFFSFVQNMSFMMFGGDKSWWRAMMVLAALAGIQGLPGAENVIDIMNWALRKITGQYVDLRVEARETAQALGANPDFVMHGITHSWGIGWDTSGSVGQGRVIPGTDAIFGIGKFEDRFMHAVGEVGGPVGSLMMSFLQAVADENPNSLLAWDKALPPVLRNLERVGNAASLEAYVSGTGRPLVADPTAVEQVGQALGFAPTRKTAAQEELHMQKDAAVFYGMRRQNLMETYYVAKKTHDFSAIAEAREAISEYNSSVPSPKLRINGEDLAKSVANREKMDRETMLDRSPVKRYQDLYNQIGSSFGG